MENSSSFPALSLSGFSFSPQQRALLFALVLLWYVVILVGNFGIIFIVALDKSMHAPMYIFLCNLCVNALYGTLGFYPKFLADLVRLVPVSYGACMLQGFVIHSSTCGDFSILTLMAYDRYVAICRPLVYHVIMTKTRVWLLVLASWLVPLTAMFMNTATLLGRALCGSTIRRIYCVNWMVTSLTCAPPPGNVAVSYFNMLFYFGHFVFVLYTYLYLVRTCVASRESTRRFLHTCVPHLASLCTYSCSTLLDLLYMRFGSANISQHLSNFFAIEFLLVPPVLNPLIYGLKLSKIRRAARRLLRAAGGARKAADSGED
ncbi:olfactory receptor-like protein OLF4 [Boleophthalmus pectinirostris]|uniref:olfactory receptor-like protein OLF4 n=1 Tax=Boleophthalmus pectinirostris TaxID=150288 RepID=UPI0024330BA3|nr:olfactory receptor-like protein OLF4 [Boleophthalmus pectinirostris]